MGACTFSLSDVPAEANLCRRTRLFLPWVLLGWWAALWAYWWLEAQIFVAGIN